MKKLIDDFIVIDNKRLNDQNFLLIVSSQKPIPTIFPGQFVEIRVDNDPDVFLRRPISVNFVDYEKNQIWLLIQIVGDGTRKLASLLPSMVVNLIYPLGNTFTLPKNKDAKLLLIGGGVGTAPLLFLGAHLHDLGFACNFLLGGRSKSNLLQLEEFARYGNIFITTEDESLGEKGFVSDHSILQKEQFDIIYTCGPTPMMKAVARYASQNNVFCEVSLENTMACGFGACLCCVTDTVDGHLCVCTEGPVFNISKLKW